LRNEVIETEWYEKSKNESNDVIVPSKSKMYSFIPLIYKCVINNNINFIIA